MLTLFAHFFRPQLFALVRWFVRRSFSTLAWMAIGQLRARSLPFQDRPGQSTVQYIVEPPNGERQRETLLASVTLQCVSWDEL